jgi:hypothetical protein
VFIKLFKDLRPGAVATSLNTVITSREAAWRCSSVRGWIAASASPRSDGVGEIAGNLL